MMVLHRKILVPYCLTQGTLTVLQTNYVLSDPGLFSAFKKQKRASKGSTGTDTFIADQLSRLRLRVKI